MWSRWTQEGVAEPWMGLVIVVGWALVVLLALLLVWFGWRLLRRQGSKPLPGGITLDREALDELEGRYARGEIDRDTYDQRRMELQS